MPDDPLYFRLRIPPNLKDELNEIAGSNDRSLNAEILQRLRNSLAPGVNESAEQYRASKNSTTLKDAVVLGEALIKETGKPMNPEKKADFIDTLYDLLVMYGDEERVKEKINNVIDMESYLKNETG